jgi:hypothetical protein
MMAKSDFLILSGLTLCTYSWMKIKNLACKAPNTTDRAEFLSHGASTASTGISALKLTLHANPKKLWVPSEYNPFK